MNTLRHVTRTHCDNCHRGIVAEGAASGYAIVPKAGTDGMTYCYTCADELSLATIAMARAGDRHTFYVSSDGHSLTTWTGGELGRVILGRLHPWSSERRYLTFVDRLGRRWSGTGAPGMFATVTLRKLTR